MRKFLDAVSAISVLCVTMQANQAGARYSFGFVLIAALVYVGYLTLKK